MKDYKPFYCASLLYACFLTCAPAIPVCVLFATGFWVAGNESLPKICLLVVAVLFLGMVATVVVITLLNLLIKTFIKSSIRLTEDRVIFTDRGTEIKFDEISYVTLYLPVLRGNSIEPQTLVLYVNESNYAHIKRPSIFLIRELKKRCAFASFQIDDLKGRLMQMLWIALVVFCTCAIFAISIV